MKKNSYIQPSVETSPVKCTMVMQTVSNPALNVGIEISGGDGD